MLNHITENTETSGNSNSGLAWDLERFGITDEQKTEKRNIALSFEDLFSVIAPGFFFLKQSLVSNKYNWHLFNSFPTSSFKIVCFLRKGVLKLELAFHEKQLGWTENHFFI